MSDADVKLTERAVPPEALEAIAMHADGHARLLVIEEHDAKDLKARYDHIAKSIQERRAKIIALVNASQMIAGKAASETIRAKLYQTLGRNEI